jgi:electron-transferring-flavoprotein dehydrogenase
VDAYLLKGKAPWTLGHLEDHATLIDSSQVKEIKYPKPDGALTFDRLSSVFLSDTNHKENQPCHIRLKNSAVPISVNFTRFAALETRYCPAEVYEVLVDEKGTLRLQINAQNCLHCKTCEIKDPTQNIKWVVPEGGGGPNYSNM